MNILEIIKSYKSMGESIKLDTTVSGIKSIDSVDFIKRDGEEFIRVKVSNSDLGTYIYYDKYGHLVLTPLTYYRVTVSTGCMLSVYSVNQKLTIPESGCYIHGLGNVYYVFKDGSIVRHLESDGDIGGDASNFYGYEIIESCDYDKLEGFIDSLINSTGIHTIFNGILREGYSIISYSPYLKGNLFRMLIDLIRKDDEIDINNVVNYVIEIPIKALNSYEFNTKDLKTYDELHD